jgi:hypothetical protein
MTNARLHAGTAAAAAKVPCWHAQGTQLHCLGALLSPALELHMLLTCQQQPSIRLLRVPVVGLLQQMNGRQRRRLLDDPITITNAVAVVSTPNGNSPSKGAREHPSNVAAQAASSGDRAMAISHAANDGIANANAVAPGEPTAQHAALQSCITHVVLCCAYSMQCAALSHLTLCCLPCRRTCSCGTGQT